MARRSIFARIVWASAGLTLVLLAGLWLLTDWTVRQSVREAAQDQVDVDLAGLVDIYASGGQRELELRIKDRLAFAPIDANTPHYILARDDGTRIVGDILTWPALDAAVSEAGYITIGQNTAVFARATRLGPELQLVVAREADGGAAIRRQIMLAFLAGGSVILVCVGAAGKLATARLGQRIGAINHALYRQETGALRALLDPEKGDEIDDLAGNAATALSRLSRLMAAYRDTSDQIAHEIRTPLMHLDRRLVRALEAQPGEAASARLIEAREEIRKLVSTLESLLDIAASKARQGDRHGLEPVDLSALANQICELYADSAEESGHLFTWTIEPGVTVEGAPMQLSRMVTNLLDNAFKYVPAGGEVTLTLQAGPVLVIADSGPGIPAAEREQIFDRFFRGKQAKAQDSGSGLGLALARAIAERHGFTLSLDDTETGASFRISGSRL